MILACRCNPSIRTIESLLLSAVICIMCAACDKGRPYTEPKQWQERVMIHTLEMGKVDTYWGEFISTNRYDARHDCYWLDYKVRPLWGYDGINNDSESNKYVTIQVAWFNAAEPMKGVMIPQKGIMLLEKRKELHGRYIPVGYRNDKAMIPMRIEDAMKLSETALIVNVQQKFREGMDTIEASKAIEIAVDYIDRIFLDRGFISSGEYRVYDVIRNFYGWKITIQRNIRYNLVFTEFLPETIYVCDDGYVIEDYMAENPNRAMLEKIIEGDRSHVESADETKALRGPSRESTFSGGGVQGTGGH